MRITREQINRWGPTVLIVIGALALLSGELWAIWNGTSGDTISERIWFVMGIGRAITPFFLFSRILVLGALSWLTLHFATKRI